ncbi:MAG: hypothetical protein V1872_13070 [bacterium]
MDIKESIRAGLKELILPELGKIREESSQIKITLEFTNKRLDDINKRLDDVNQHLIDQSRRIDDTNKRIDNTNDRIDELRVELRGEMLKMNTRIDRLYEVIVRRDEHNKLEQQVRHLQEEVAEIKEKLKLAA